MICNVCGKKISGKTFVLEIRVKKQVLTSYGFGITKDYKEILGHYRCLKYRFEGI